MYHPQQEGSGSFLSEPLSLRVQQTHLVIGARERLASWWEVEVLTFGLGSSIF